MTPFHRGRDLTSAKTVAIIRTCRRCFAKYVAHRDEAACCESCAAQATQSIAAPCAPKNGGAA